MHLNNSVDTPELQNGTVESTGAWPFVTRKVAVHSDGRREVLSSRHHRKGLALAARIERRALASLWQPRELNWWIGTIFAIGAALFAIASVLYLTPDLAHSWAVEASGISALYFAGSIPFTTAAYLQLFQAANAPDWEHTSPRLRRRLWFGWRPRDIGWTSCALQFAGTLLFNINTFDGMNPDMSWFEEDLTVWIPNLIGSVLFLASGYLAFAETCHKHFAWIPQSLSWWITSFNLLGCVGFMVSAVFAFVSPQADGFGNASAAIVFTLVGALGFFVGSLLMLPESMKGLAHD
jgi:hypothetical protein